MKKIISLALAVVFCVSMASSCITAGDTSLDTTATTAEVATAAETESTGSKAKPSGKALRFDDIDSPGGQGYCVNDRDYTKFLGSEEEVPAGQRFSEKGVTVAFDLMVSEVISDQTGYFAHIPFFVNGTAPHNYASFNFTPDVEGMPVHSMTEIYTAPWPTYNPVIEPENYLLWNEMDFDWEFGEWYRVAVKFERNYIYMYVNGELMCEWDFDNNDNAFILMYPQRIHCYFDNFVTATAAYDVENENWKRNPEVYDVMDFENGVEGGHWGFGGAYTVVSESNIYVPSSPVGILGDANSDKSVDLKDVAALIRANAGYADVEVNADVANVNDDAEVDSKDIALLLRYCANYEVPYGIGDEKLIYGEIYIQ